MVGKRFSHADGFAKVSLTVAVWLWADCGHFGNTTCVSFQPHNES